MDAFFHNPAETSARHIPAQGRLVTLIHPVQHEPHSATSLDAGGFAAAGASLRLRSGPGIRPRRAWGGRGRSPPLPPNPPAGIRLSFLRAALCAVGGFAAWG